MSHWTRRCFYPVIFLNFEVVKKMKNFGRINFLYRHSKGDCDTFARVKVDLKFNTYLMWVFIY